jgi:hypothetical protein
MNAHELCCAIRGPVTLITIGTLFAFDHFTRYGINRTWPVLLIVIGLLTLVCRGVESTPNAGGQR